MKGIWRTKFTALFSDADAALPGVTNYRKYYIKCENPWEARFKVTGKD